MRNDAFDAAQLLRARDRGAEAAAVRRHAGRPAAAQAHVLLRELRGHARAPGRSSFNNTVADRGDARRRLQRDRAASSTTRSRGQPFPGNVIPANRLSPQALYFARFMPDPEHGRRAPSPGRRCASSNTDQVTRAHRSDAQRQARASSAATAGTISGMDDPNRRTRALGNAPLSTRGQNVVLSMTNTLSLDAAARGPLQLRARDRRSRGLSAGHGPRTRAPACAASRRPARPGVGGSFPDFSWSGYTAMNGSAFDQRPKTQDLKVWEVTDNVTWITGRHIVKFGGKFRRWVPLFTDSKQYAGQWSFDGSITQNPASPAGTGDAFADFLLGYPRQVTRAFPADTFGGQANYWHGYVQDDFKVSSRLTLNVGLRYEYSPWLSGYRGQVGTFEPGSARPIIVGERERPARPRLAVRRAVGLRALPELHPDQQPGRAAALDHQHRHARSSGRASASPGSRSARQTVVRGGYGLFYEQESSDDRVNNNMVPFRLDQTGVQRSVAAGPDDGGLLPRHERSPTRRRRRSARARSSRRWAATITSASACSRRSRPFTVLEVNYVGNIGRFLNGTTNINIPEPGAGRHPGAAALSRSSAASATSTTRMSRRRTIRCRRRSSSAAARRPVLPGVLHLVEEHHDAERAGGRRQHGPREGALGASTSRTTSRSAPATSCRSGAAAASSANANGVVDAVLGGWQVQGIYIWRSGRPFTPTISSDRANTGVGGQRPNRIGSGELDNPTVERVVRQDRVRRCRRSSPTAIRAAASCARTATRRSISRCSSASASTAAVPRPRCFNLTNTPSFNAPEHRDRHRGRGPRHEHAQHAPADAVRVEVQVLTNASRVTKLISRRNARIGCRLPRCAVRRSCVAASALRRRATPSPQRPQPFPVTIQVDAAKPPGALKPIWRFFGADEPNYAYMKDGQKLLARARASSAPHAGLLPRAQPARHRRRHARAEVGQHQRLHRGRAGQARSTTGRSSTASSTPTCERGVQALRADRLHAAGAVDQAGALPARVDARRAVRRDLHRLGLPAEGLREVGRAGLPVGRSTASSGTAGPRSRAGTGRSGTSRTSATGTARPRSSTSCTTTPSTACAARCRRRASAGRTPPGTAASSLRDFLEHCLRGTNYATGKTGTPIDFVSFHAKGAPEVRRRPRADGHRQPAARRSTTASAIIASFPELKSKPIVIGESDPDGCAACQGPQLGYRNGTMYSSYTAASFARKHDLAEQARREPRGRADLGLRVRGPAVLRRLPRAGDATASTCRCSTSSACSAGWAAERVAVDQRRRRPVSTRSMKDGVRGEARRRRAGQPRRAASSRVLAWHYHDDDVAGPDAAVDAVARAGSPLDAAARRSCSTTASTRATATPTRRGSGWARRRAQRQQQYTAARGASQLARSRRRPATVRRRRRPGHAADRAAAAGGLAARRRVVSACERLATTSLAILRQRGDRDQLSRSADAAGGDQGDRAGHSGHQRAVLVAAVGVPDRLRGDVRRRRQADGRRRHARGLPVDHGVLVARLREPRPGDERRHARRSAGCCSAWAKAAASPPRRAPSRSGSRSTSARRPWASSTPAPRSAVSWRRR